MHAQEVADGVHVAESGGLVNWVLVVSDEGLLAVDAGLRSAWSELEALCARLGRAPRELRAILLTHGHVDHTGFARRAQVELGTPVHVHPADVALLEHPLTASPPERFPLTYLGAAPRRALGQMLRGGALRTAIPRDTVALAPGAALGELPGAPVALATPGHTAGHCSIHLPAHGVLVAGDALVTYDPYTGTSGPRLIARGSMRSSADARASLDVLEAVEAAVLVPGHGPVWTGGAAEAARRARDAPQG
jgi:glyoxylase-like metal-dependent hydrolase (beta-lactamase superfamily II)